MVTKEELKKEVDRLPESLVEEVYSLLKKVLKKKAHPRENNWNLWKNNLDKFTPDFMDNRNQSDYQSRESFD